MRKTDGVVYPGSPGGPACGPARDNGVWVMAEQCATCIFRPGNPMDLEPGTVKRMKTNADTRGTCIVCHEVMHGPNAAVCRGYYDSHNSGLLQVAERMGLIKYETGVSSNGEVAKEASGMEGLG